MSVSIAVCDDSPQDRGYIVQMVSRWAECTGRAVHITEYPSAENYLFLQNPTDILLLDIEMEGMDGVTLAKKLRRDNEILQIVFITGYSDYIAEGYEVSALHYLMKPVKEEKLFCVLNRAADKLAKNERLLTFQSAGETVQLPIYQIRCAQVSGNYVTIHAGFTVTVKMTLGDLEKQLDDRFHRVGRSAIVNLTQIRRVTKTDIYLSDGTVIALPRGVYEAVNRAIIALQ